MLWNQNVLFLYNAICSVAPGLKASQFLANTKHPIFSHEFHLTETALLAILIYWGNKTFEINHWFCTGGSFLYNFSFNKSSSWAEN